MQKEIIELIKSLIKDTAFGEITSETELIESGILDSFALITMMTELESKYQLEISDEYFEIDNFKNVNKIAETVLIIKGM